MKTLVLANQKGGVGKSTVGCQFAYYLVQRALRVLYLDLDHQRNSSKAIVKSGKAVTATYTSSHVLLGQSDVVAEGAFVIVQADEMLDTLERQPDQHNTYVNAFKAYLNSVAERFDVCIIDTHPNPDIRYAVAMVTGDFVLSPVQLNQEAIDGIGLLLNHHRYGYRKIKQALNKNLNLIGLLPNLVEPTPFQRQNFKQLAERYASLLIATDTDAQRYAYIPTRTALAEAQAEGLFLAEMKKTSARDAWREIKGSLEVIAQRMTLGV